MNTFNLGVCIAVFSHIEEDIQNKQFTKAQFIMMTTMSGLVISLCMRMTCMHTYTAVDHMPGLEHNFEQPIVSYNEQ